MALDSARVWSKEIGLSGLILTKLDGTARGGSVVAVSRDLRLPVKLIGVGEGIDDLRDVSGSAVKACVLHSPAPDSPFAV
jgi:fused signal recognition particle receptor